VPTGCGGKIQAEESSSLLQSPNYPHIYFPNLDCFWIIQPKIISKNNTADSSNHLTNVSLTRDICKPVPMGRFKPFEGAAILILWKGFVVNKSCHWMIN